MEFSQRKNYYVSGLETLFGMEAIRLNVTVEREQIPTTAKHMKMVVTVPRKSPLLLNLLANMKISQLKRKIENEFEELYPRESTLQI